MFAVGPDKAYRKGATLNNSRVIERDTSTVDQVNKSIEDTCDRCFVPNDAHAIAQCFKHRVHGVGSIEAICLDVAAQIWWKSMLLPARSASTAARKCALPCAFHNASSSERSPPAREPKVERVRRCWPSTNSTHHPRC